MTTTNFTPKTGLFAQDSTSTCSIEKVAMLEEMKALYNKGELSEADAERWNFLCESLYNGNFRELLLDNLDDDQELTFQMLDNLKNTGTSIQQLAFGGIAVGMHILDALYPTNCGYDSFGDFWLEPCWGHESIHQTLANAFNRAIDKMVSEEMEEADTTENACLLEDFNKALQQNTCPTL